MKIYEEQNKSSLLAVSGGAFCRLLVHELGESFNFTTIILPQLSVSIAATYGGYDSIYLQNRQFFHEFRIRNRTDTLAGEKAGSGWCICWKIIRYR